MKKLGSVLRRVYWTITALAVVSTFTLATYAWFTNNRKVTSDTVTGRTGSEDLELQISEDGGTAFSPVDIASIVQVNQADQENLLPVSTSDLQTFITNSATIGSEARTFQRVENEADYYHGRIYLRAQAEGISSGTRMALYLDLAEEAGGTLVQDASDEFLAATRLGLTFNDTDPVIFRLNDVVASPGIEGNTYLNDNLLDTGKVLSWDGQQVISADDPSVTIDQYVIQMDDTSVTLPQQPLCYLDLNTVYAVDIFFYIEGCDPDCTDAVYKEQGSLHLAFYGILE